MSAAVTMRLTQLDGRQVPVLSWPEQDRPDGNCL